MTRENPGLPEKDESERNTKSPDSEAETDYERKIQKLADDWDRVLAKLGIPEYDPEAPTTLEAEGILIFSTEEEAREFWRKKDEEQQERQAQARLRKKDDEEQS
jgi:hypothetical protein